MMDTRQTPSVTKAATPPGPCLGWIPGRLEWAFRRDPLGFLTSLAHDYGDIACVRLGGFPLYLVNHPEFIRAVLEEDGCCFAEAEILPRVRALLGNSLPACGVGLLQRQRRQVVAVPPALGRQQIDCYGDGIVRYAALTTGRWQNGKTLDMHTTMRRLSLEITSRVLLGFDLEGRVGDEAATLLEAGYQPLANALTWTWYLLAQHPGIQERLHAELSAVFGSRRPTVQGLERLPYTRQVLSEVLRLYPPVWAVERRALQDCTLGGYLIPAGATLLASQWVMHHDPRYYPDPERFDPGRWTPGAWAARPPYAFFPFVGALRLAQQAQPCIDEDFAWLAMLLVLATIAQEWRVSLPAVRLPASCLAVARPTLTLQPRYGMRLRLQCFNDL